MAEVDRNPVLSLWTTILTGDRIFGNLPCISLYCTDDALL